jgi:hypothetical protein
MKPNKTAKGLEEHFPFVFERVVIWGVVHGKVIAYRVCSDTSGDSSWDTDHIS